MIALLLLPILVSGFYVMYNHHYYKYILHRYEGQLLYLKSAELGVLCMTSFTLIALILNSAPSAILGFPVDIPKFVENTFKTVGYKGKATKLNSWLILIATGTLFSAGLWCFITSKFMKFKCADGNICSRLWQASFPSKSLTEHAKLISLRRAVADSPIDSLCVNGSIERFPILFTLKTGKVYLGVISAIGEPKENDRMTQEISIVPLASGYRKSECLTVVFKNAYEYSESPGDYLVVLKQEEIVTASRFDLEAKTHNLSALRSLRVLDNSMFEWGSRW